MKHSILALAVTAAVAGFAHPAFAQDASHAVPQVAQDASPAPVADTTADPNKQQQGPKLKKPVPKHAAADGTLVAGGVLGAAAVIGLAAGGGGGGNDQPSSP